MEDVVTVMLSCDLVESMKERSYSLTRSWNLRTNTSTLDVPIFTDLLWRSRASCCALGADDILCPV